MRKFMSLNIIIFSIQLCFAQTGSVDYFEQIPPGTTPEKFAPGFVSRDGRYELMSTFSNDGKEFCFSVTDYRWSHFEIWYTRYDANKWSEPQIIPLPNSPEGFSPFFSPGNHVLFFSSPNWTTHPVNIWFTPRTQTGWGLPVKLSNPVNSGFDQWGFSMAADSTLLFCSTRPGGKGNYDIYISEPVDHKYKNPVNLENLNSSADEYSAFIAPDKSYIIFSSQRSEGKGWDDLYISFRKNKSTWSEPVNLGPLINTANAEFAPHVTPDGKYMIYSVWDKNSQWSDLYWVRVDHLINRLKLAMLNH